MSEGSAWVTLATNDSYCLGALVLAHSLRRANTAHPMVILVTPGVTPIMKERLSQIFAEVINVDVLDSGDAAHLALLARPELGITFTKLHCWTLTQYNKCVFLDADTLVLQNCDELFEREELSAAPDVGWPDCFNSGVFVYRPSNETFTSLVEFAKEKGSFDGGDQGLLNQYFSSWATGDISKHLSFLYNVCSTSFYSYLPALKQYGQNIKIVHFIGQVKPWLENFNWGSRSVGGSGTLQGPLQYWWDIFIDQVHPVLDVAMGRHVEAGSPALYTPPNPPQFPWHRPITPPPTPDHHHYHQESLHNDFVDPWEVYAPPPPPQPQPKPEDQPKQEPYHNNHYQPVVYTQYVEVVERQDFSHQDEQPTHHVENHMNEEEIRNMYTPKAWYECYTNEKEEQNVPQIVNFDDSMSQDISICGPGGMHCGTEYTEVYSQEDDSSICNGDIWHDATCQGHHDEDEPMTVVDNDVRPRHPYDNFYLLHQVVLGPQGHKRCTHEAPPVVPEPPSPSPPPTPEEDQQSGVAGALSQLSIGGTGSSPAMDEHLRRQGWEAGNIDYMGADAFDNIWAKISQTLSIAPASSGPAPTSAPEPAPTPVTPTPAPAPVAEESLPASRASTESFEQVSSGIVAAVSDISISKPSSLENSSDSSFTTVSSAAPSVTKETTALTEVKADQKQVCMETSGQPPAIQESSIKPMEKLVCHLKPMVESDPLLLTPESELEDAATIAQKIIASEEALSSPTVTSATPMTTPPICPIIPQNVKDLIVETAIPDTPPLSGPVSLAQIGIIPSKQVTDVKKIPSIQPSNEPKTLVQLTESKVLVDSMECSIPKAPVPTAQSPKPDVPKTPEPEAVVECVLSKTKKSNVETPKPKEIKESAAPKTPECELPKTKKSAEEVLKPKETPKTPTECELPKAKEPAVEKPKVTKEPEAPKTPTESLPKTPKTPEPVEEKSSEETKPTVKKVKKVVKQKSSTETPPKTPDAEAESKKLVCSLKTKDDPPKTIAEVTLPTDLQNVSLPKTLEKAILPSKDKVEKKPAESEKKAEAATTKEEPAKVEKKEEPATPTTEEAAAKPKVVKKVVKKVPATPKTDAADSEGAKKGAEGPVPPPRKKIVKPKEK